MKYSTLRPGLLVSLSARLSGNVIYASRDLEREHLTEDGSKFSKWETERTIQDPEEHDEAIKLRSRARSLITGVCSHSSFGLLCPERRGDDLANAIEEAHRLADEFNRRSRLTKLSVYVICGRVAPDDVEAVRAINSEVTGLLSDMEAGLQKLDVKAVREAANKAKAIGAMLSPEAADRIQTAIDAARSAARKIVKAGDEIAAEIDVQAIRKITESRTAFLDLGEIAEVAEPESVGRAIDLTPEADEMEQLALLSDPKVRIGPDVLRDFAAERDDASAPAPRVPNFEME